MVDAEEMEVMRSRSSGVKDLISSFERRGSKEFEKPQPLLAAPTPLRNRGALRHAATAPASVVEAALSAAPAAAADSAPVAATAPAPQRAAAAAAAAAAAPAVAAAPAPAAAAAAEPTTEPAASTAPCAEAAAAAPAPVVAVTPAPAAAAAPAASAVPCVEAAAPAPTAPRALAAAGGAAASAVAESVSSDEELVDRALQEAERIARQGRFSQASTAASLETMQAKIRAEVDRQFNLAMQRMAQEQEDALQKVQELKEKSMELEQEVERSRRESRPRRRSSAEPAAAAQVDEHDRIRSLIMTPRMGDAEDPGQAGASSSSDRNDAGASRESVGGASRDSVAPKALRRHSTSCAAVGAGASAASASSARSSLGRKSAGGYTSDLKLLRRWMVEQRSNLMEELYPFGGPVTQPKKATRSRASAPGAGCWRPDAETIQE